MKTKSHGAELIPVDANSFESAVLHAELPALVAFGCDWSKPCKRVRSALKTVAAQCHGTVRTCIVNVDENPELGVWYGIERVPTLLCFVQGQEQLRLVGTVSPTAVLTRLQPFMTKTAGATSPSSTSNPPLN